MRYSFLFFSSAQLIALSLRLAEERGLIALSLRLAEERGLMLRWLDEWYVPPIKLAAEMGISKSSVHRILSQARLQPHRLERYMASNDPEFETKAADIIGLYLEPPQHAAVFCKVRFHFTPTCSSWFNQIELWFAKIQRDLLARGIFTCVADLSRKIRQYIRAYAKLARPFRWSYSDPSRRIITNPMTGTAY